MRARMALFVPLVMFCCSPQNSSPQTIEVPVPTPVPGPSSNNSNDDTEPCAGDKDTDNDGVCDKRDNCVLESNANQSDLDQDSWGDACDACAEDRANDADDDDVCGNDDNCPFFPNTTQTDTDNDGLGNACDPCTLRQGVTDTDNDGYCGIADNCPAIANAQQQDQDWDGIGDACDNCVQIYNPLQEVDGQGVSIACSADDDDDGVLNSLDNCPLTSNPSQSNQDSDTWGDACDECPMDNQNDQDNDNVCYNQDNCPNVANSAQTDADSDGVGNACDTCPNAVGSDTDNDGRCAPEDTCPSVYDPNPVDADNDGLSDACDPCPGDTGNDSDGDILCGAADNCPAAYNPQQKDTDDDGVGDACDPCPYDEDKGLGFTGSCTATTASNSGVRSTTNIASTRISAQPSQRGSSRTDLPAFPSESAYVRDPVVRWTHDQTMEAFIEMNYLLCVLGQTRYADMANGSERYYLADVAIHDCPLLYMMSVGAGEFWNENGADVVTRRLLLRTQGSIDSLDYGEPSHEPLHVSLWGLLPIVFDHAVSLEIDLHALPSENHPYGWIEFKALLKDTRVLAPGNVPAHKYMTFSVLPNNAGDDIFHYTLQDGTFGSSIYAASMELFPSTQAGKGRVAVNNLYPGHEYVFQYDQQEFIRNDFNGNTPSGTLAFDRREMRETVWRYEMYDENGDRIPRTGKNNIYTVPQGSSTRTAMTFTPLLDPAVLTFPPTSPFTDDLFHIFPNPLQYTVTERLPNGEVGNNMRVFQSKGRLWKYTRSEATLADLTGQVLRVPGTPSEAYSWEGTAVRWTGSQFERVGSTDPFHQFQDWEQTGAYFTDRIVLRIGKTPEVHAYDFIELFASCTPSTGSPLTLDCDYNGNTAVAIHMAEFVPPFTETVPSTLSTWGVSESLRSTYHFDNERYMLVNAQDQDVTNMSMGYWLLPETMPEIVLYEPTPSNNALLTCLPNADCSGEKVLSLPVTYVWRAASSNGLDSMRFTVLYEQDGRMMRRMTHTLEYIPHTYTSANGSCDYEVSFSNGWNDRFKGVPSVPVSTKTNLPLDENFNPITWSDIPACYTGVDYIPVNQLESRRLVPLFNVPVNRFFKYWGENYAIRPMEVEQRLPLLSTPTLSLPTNAPALPASNVIYPTCIGKPPKVLGPVSVYGGAILPTERSTTVCHSNCNADYLAIPWNDNPSSSDLRTRETDADCDGILDLNDSCPSSSPAWTRVVMPDIDQDGCLDPTEDNDDDNDGILDTQDMCTVANGFVSNLTLDADQDGCQDSNEGYILDSDNDGIVDSADSCPRDGLRWTSNAWLDANGDGCRDTIQAPYWRIYRGPSRAVANGWDQDAWVITEVVSATSQEGDITTFTSDGQYGNYSFTDGTTECALDTSSQASNRMYLVDDNLQSSWMSLSAPCCSANANSYDSNPWLALQFRYSTYLQYTPSLAEVFTGVTLKTLTFVQSYVNGASEVIVEVSKDNGYRTGWSRFGVYKPSCVLQGDQETCTLTLQP